MFDYAVFLRRWNQGSGSEGLLRVSIRVPVVLFLLLVRFLFVFIVLILMVGHISETGIHRRRPISNVCSEESWKHSDHYNDEEAASGISRERTRSSRPPCPELPVRIAVTGPG